MAENDRPQLPGFDQRTLIVGQTGSGKSVGGAHLLLQYRQRDPSFPWVIFNPKCDPLLDRIGAEPWDLKKGLPKSGLNGNMIVTHPVAESEEDDDQVNLIIDQAMHLGNVGLYFDEGYSIPSNSKSFRRALTQGRSRHVPVIVLSQRPVFLDKFAFTEAGIHRVFYLLDALDRKKIKENTGISITDDMPRYHSYWYDVAKRRSWHIGSGPSPRDVIDGFKNLEPPPKKSWLPWKR